MIFVFVCCCAGLVIELTKSESIVAAYVCLKYTAFQNRDQPACKRCSMSHVSCRRLSSLTARGGRWERESHEKKKNISKWFGRICIVIVVCILRVGLGSLSRIRSSFLSGLHEVVNERWLQKTKLRVQVSNWFQHEHDFSPFVDMINNTRQQNSTHIHERISNLGVFLLYRLPEYIHLLFLEFNPRQLANN